MLLERLLRTAWTIIAGDARMRLQMLIERGDLSEFLRTLITTILLDFVVGFHVIVEISDLGKGATTFRFDANERTFARMQTPMIVEVGNLEKGMQK